MKRFLQVFACVVVVGWSLPAPGDEPSVPYSSPSAHAGQQTAPEAAARTVTLDEASRLALTNEEQIKLAGRELSKAQLLPWRAITQLTPRADVTGTYTRNKEEIAFVFPEGFGGSRAGTTSAIRPLESWQGIFALTQPLLQPSFFPAQQLGKDTVQKSRQQYDFTARQVIFGVAFGCYSNDKE